MIGDMVRIFGVAYIDGRLVATSYEVMERKIEKTRAIAVPTATDTMPKRVRGAGIRTEKTIVDHRTGIYQYVVYLCNIYHYPALHDHTQIKLLMGLPPYARLPARIHLKKVEAFCPNIKQMDFVEGLENDYSDKSLMEYMEKVTSTANERPDLFQLFRTIPRLVKLGRDVAKDIESLAQYLQNTPPAAVADIRHAETTEQFYRSVDSRTLSSTVTEPPRTDANGNISFSVSVSPAMRKEVWSIGTEVKVVGTGYNEPVLASVQSFRESERADGLGTVLTLEVCPRQYESTTSTYDLDDNYEFVELEVRSAAEAGRHCLAMERGRHLLLKMYHSKPVKFDPLGTIRHQTDVIEGHFDIALIRRLQNAAWNFEANLTDEFSAVPFPPPPRQLAAELNALPAYQLEEDGDNETYWRLVNKFRELAGYEESPEQCTYLLALEHMAHNAKYTAMYPEYNTSPPPAVILDAAFGSGKTSTTCYAMRTVAEVLHGTVFAFVTKSNSSVSAFMTYISQQAPLDPSAAAVRPVVIESNSFAKTGSVVAHSGFLYMELRIRVFMVWISNSNQWSLEAVQNMSWNAKVSEESVNAGYVDCSRVVDARRKADEKKLMNEAISHYRGHSLKTARQFYGCGRRPTGAGASKDDEASSETMKLLEDKMVSREGVFKSVNIDIGFVLLFIENYFAVRAGTVRSRKDQTRPLDKSKVVVAGTETWEDYERVAARPLKNNSEARRIIKRPVDRLVAARQRAALRNGALADIEEEDETDDEDEEEKKEDPRALSPTPARPVTDEKEEDDDDEEKTDDEDEVDDEVDDEEKTDDEDKVEDEEKTDDEDEVDEVEEKDEVDEVEEKGHDTRRRLRSHYVEELAFVARDDESRWLLAARNENFVVEARSTMNMGTGLFAKMDIPANSILCRYDGDYHNVAMSAHEVDKDARRSRCIALSSSSFVYATTENTTSLGHFMNHSGTPNAQYKRILVTISGKPQWRVIVKSLHRPIKENEEIYADYADDTKLEELSVEDLWVKK